MHACVCSFDTWSRVSILIFSIITETATLTACNKQEKRDEKQGMLHQFTRYTIHVIMQHDMRVFTHHVCTISPNDRRRYHWIHPACPKLLLAKEFAVYCRGGLRFVSILKRASRQEGWTGRWFIIGHRLHCQARGKYDPVQVIKHGAARSQ